MINKLTLISLTILLALALAACSKESSSGGKENYIVVLKKQARGQAFTKASVNAMMADTASKFKLDKPIKVFNRAIQGGVVQMTAEEAAEMAEVAEVAYVEKDQIITVNAVQQNPTWGLDRIDQDDRPLDDAYAFPDTDASNVNAYVIDTGIKNSHVDFEGRAVSGADLVDDDADATDCNGHGTHVAGTLGSKTYGVAKSVKLHGVRVLNCRGSGSLSDVIAGVEWVAENHSKPAVANLSLGGRNSQALDDAVIALVQSGVTVVVAAGNSNVSACSGSPNRVAQAITVGATTKSDARSSFSNYGECVDVFAPGSDIKSTYHTSNTATDTLDGTSMAAPHVAGVAALYLAQNPDAAPDEVASAIVGGAASGKLSSLKSGSPNLLLSNLFLDDGDGGVDPEPDPDPEPDDNDLEDGEVRTVSGERFSEKSFTIELTSSAAKLTVEIYGGTGDADLYVKKGSAATQNDYDCRPYLNGNVEKCEVEDAGSGVYHIMLRGYLDYENVSLKVKVEEGAVENTPCADCAEESGTLTGSADLKYHPGGTYYQRTSSGNHQVWLEGPADADFDLYLMKWENSKWNVVARSTKSSSEEQINYFGKAGFYTVKVDSFTGVGDYKVWMK